MGNDSCLAHTELLGCSWRGEGGAALCPGRSQHPALELQNVSGAGLVCWAWQLLHVHVKIRLWHGEGAWQPHPGFCLHQPQLDTLDFSNILLSQGLLR
ncbi:unnamed protein product [Coccothraustes coccothraustes]